jgi:hypothetical protein
MGEMDDLGYDMILRRMTLMHFVAGNRQTLSLKFIVEILPFAVSFHALWIS